MSWQQDVTVHSPVAFGATEIDSHIVCSCLIRRHVTVVGSFATYLWVSNCGLESGYPNRNSSWFCSVPVMKWRYKSYSCSFTDLDRPWGLQKFEAVRFLDNQHTEVARLSVLSTGRLYPAENISRTHFCWRLSRLQGHSAAGKIMSMKYCNNTIGNRTRDIPACSAVSQPTTACPQNAYTVPYAGHSHIFPRLFHFISR
jgi:hypothetical protein